MVSILKEEKNNKLNEIKEGRMNKDEYGYDFVPELFRNLNIDEQQEGAKRLEHISDEEK